MKLTDGTNASDHVLDLGVHAVGSEPAAPYQTQCDGWSVVVVKTPGLSAADASAVDNATNSALLDVAASTPTTEMSTRFLFAQACYAMVNVLKGLFSPAVSVRMLDDEDACANTIPGFVFRGHTTSTRTPEGFISTSRQYDVALGYSDEGIGAFKRVDALFLHDSVPVIDVRHALQNNPNWICWENECEILLHPLCIVQPATFAYFQLVAAKFPTVEPEEFSILEVFEPVDFSWARKRR